MGDIESVMLDFMIKDDCDKFIELLQEGLSHLPSPLVDFSPLI